MTPKILRPGALLPAALSAWLGVSAACSSDDSINDAGAAAGQGANGGRDGNATGGKPVTASGGQAGSGGGQPGAAGKQSTGGGGGAGGSAGGVPVGKGGAGGLDAGAAVPACDDSSDPARCTACLAEESTSTTVDALVTCSCVHCYAELEACYGIADSAEAALCRTVVACSRASGCRGVECYCGADVDLPACVSGGGAGPCADEMVAAAGCESETDPAMRAGCVAAAIQTLGSTLALANDVGVCSAGDPGLDPPAQGNCAGL